MILVYLQSCVCVSAKSLQMCLTLCNHMACTSVCGFSRQGYWRGLPHPPLPKRGIECVSSGPPVLQADSLLGKPKVVQLLTKASGLIYLFIFGCAVCGILVPWPGIKLVPLALGAQSLNHWTTREIPSIILLSWREGVKVTRLCWTLCDPMDCAVHGILQTGILEWVAVPFSKGSSQPRGQTQVSCIAGGFFTSWATREALWREGRC